MYKISQIVINNHNLDLTGKTVIPSKIIIDLLSALTSLTNQTYLGSLQLQLTLPDAKVINITKQNDLLLLNSNPVNDFWQELAQLVNDPDFNEYNLLASFNNLDLNSEVLTGLIRSFVEVNQTTSQTLEQVLQTASQYNSPEINSYLQTFYKVQQATSKLEKQKLVDEASELLEQTLQQISSANLQKQGVTQVISMLTQVEQNLANYTPINKPTLEQDSLRFKQDILQIRQEQLIAKSKDVINPVLNKQEVKLPKLLTFRFGLFCLVAQSVLLATTLLITSNFFILLPGIALILLTALLVYLTRFINPTIKILNKNQANIASENTAVATSQNKKLEFLEKFFVQKAWLNALKQEVQSLTTQINNKLGGIDYNQLTTSLNQLLNFASNLSYLYVAFKKLDLAPSEFLRTRQELDNGKLELIELEQQISSQDNYAQVLELSSALYASSEPVALNLPAQLLGEQYVNLYVSAENQIGNLNAQGDFEAVELTADQTLNIYLWLRLNKLTSTNDLDSAIPYIFILPASAVGNLSITIKDQIAKLVTELNQLVIWQTN